MPIHQDEKGYRLKIVASRGGHYAAMCSDSDKIKKDKGFDALNADINKIFDSVFEKGIYQKIEVGSLMLYEILKRSLSKYLVDISYVNNNELFDFIYEDYERIILQNRNRQV